MPFNFEKAAEIHGNKFDYRKVVYKNVDTKVTIICPIHGEFEQTPWHHINRKQGCGLCKGERIRKVKQMTVQEFINKSQVIHNDRYDYSKVDKIVNAHEHVMITCKKHGDFSQNPNNHIYNECGCPRCGYNVSKNCTLWLDGLGIPQECREKVLFVRGRKFKVDAFVPNTNTIYEYFGNFWHGNPLIYNPEDINPKNKRKFGELYAETVDKIQWIQNSEYFLHYTWDD